MNEPKIQQIVLNEAKRRKQVVYGTRAMNIQLKPLLDRKTFDWDIYTRNPRGTANRMQRKLDREVAEGRDDFYSKRAKHRGTHRVMHEGEDETQRTKDDISIVDYTKMPPNIATILFQGVKYETLSSIKKGKKKILKDPKSSYRHAKDRGDLAKIDINEGINRLFAPLKPRKREKGGGLLRF